MHWIHSRSSTDIVEVEVYHHIYDLKWRGETVVVEKQRGEVYFAIAWSSPYHSVSYPHLDLVVLFLRNTEWKGFCCRMIPEWIEIALL